MAMPKRLWINILRTKRAYEHPYNDLSGLLAKETQFRTKYQKLWDDSMFNADREGANNNAGICLYILFPFL